MPYKVNVKPSDRQFEVESSETILMASIRQGVGLPYGCKDGACGVCKCKMLSGCVEYENPSALALTALQQQQGWILTCSAIAQSDITLESLAVGSTTSLPIQEMPARVAKIESLAPDVIRLTLQLPASESIDFYPGQYLDIKLSDGQRRSYSIATAPGLLRANGVTQLQLHIRLQKGGRFTSYVFEKLKEREILRIVLPYGSFYLRPEGVKPIILLASGTGMAPIQAILEHLRLTGNTRKITLYWGGRRPHDLYLDQWVKEQLVKMPNLSYIPVISDALQSDQWVGRVGFVHAAVLQDLPDLSNHQVYACGTAPMVDAARLEFIANAHLPETEFFSDAFIIGTHPKG